MKKILTVALVLLTLTSTATALSYGKSFNIDLTAHNDGDIEISRVQIARGQRSTETQGNYTIKLLTESNETVQSHSFKPGFKTSGHTIGSGTRLNETSSTVDEKVLSLWLPYNRTAVKLIGLYNGEVMVKKDLTSSLCTSGDNTCSGYCSRKKVDLDCTCGDNVCQKGLNERELCKQDCKVPDNPEPVNNSGNSTESPETKEVVDQSYSIYILGLIAVVAIIILIFFLSGKVKIEE